MNNQIFRVNVLVLLFSISAYYLFHYTSCSEYSELSVLETSSDLPVNSESSEKLLNVIAFEAHKGYGDNQSKISSNSLATQKIVNMINSYTPDTLEKSERYAANMIAIAKLREEIMLDAKEYLNSIISQTMAIQNSTILQKKLLAAEEKFKLSENNYIIAKKASERAIDIYIEFIRPNIDPKSIKTIHTEGEALMLAHNQLRKMDKVSLPDMDASDYEPLNIDDSILSFAESPAFSEETRENRLRRVLDEVSSDIEEKEEIPQHKLENYEEDIEEVKSIEDNTQQTSANLLVEGNIRNDESVDLVDDQSNAIDKYQKPTFLHKAENEIDDIKEEAKIKLDELFNIRPTELNTAIMIPGDVPLFLQYAYRRCYINAMLGNFFLEVYVLPNLISPDGISSGCVHLRSYKVYEANSLYGIAGMYRKIIIDMRRLPYIQDTIPLEESIMEIQLKVDEINELLCISLRTAPKSYRKVAEMIKKFPYNVKSTLAMMSPDDRRSPDVDYSFTSQQSTYAAPPILLPPLTPHSEVKLSEFDRLLQANKIPTSEIKKKLKLLKETPPWVKDFVIKNSNYKYHQFRFNPSLWHYVDFFQFGLQSPTNPNSI
ncbi:hypothetical protein cand_034900 [Cryptosporidium andersoni]|uniref:Uncharacterized protein n=1 Tax=Cryptosporidium andersoni TaxID=117008 RepID=A0A1J4MVH0_9CRYT|nr:hypothetical protein cand_034900 [Cryptosporidium andersoni]